MKAKIPFNFIVNKTDLPAGAYVLQDLGTAGAAMMIRSSDDKVVNGFLPNTCESNKVPEVSKLVFHRYGSQYFLTQIWTAGNPRGRELPKSGREREVAMDYTPQDVVVVATLR